MSACEDRLTLDSGYQELQRTELLSPGLGRAPATAPWGYLRDHSLHDSKYSFTHSVIHSFIHLFVGCLLSTCFAP